MNQIDENRRLKDFAILAVILGFAALLIGLSTLVGNELLVGWLRFIGRVIPKVKVRVDGVAVFGVGTLLVCAFTHSFLKWLVRESQLKRSVPLVPWRLSSSIALVAIILLVFAIGISMAGIVHQIGWIMNSPRGLYVSEIQTEEDASRSPYDPAITASGTDVSWIYVSLPFYYIRPDLDRTLPWNAEPNKQKLKVLVMDVLCPSQGYPHKSMDGLGLTHVVGNREVTESGQRLRSSDFSDTSRTILAGEINVGFSPWAMPNNGRSPANGISQDWSRVGNQSLGFGSAHTAGANIIMVDASVSFMSRDTDPKVLEQLGRLKTK